jgi:LPXTG-site transpeptidase (sortase) family protein
MVAIVVPWFALHLCREISWNRVVYLEGTAYPSWTGNTALTGHVVLPNGLPRPFAGLDQLTWNDPIWLDVNGLRYEYRVTYSWQTHPNDLSVFRYEDLDVLTLITCADYDSHTQEYRQRSIVRAILMRVDKLDPQP